MKPERGNHLGERRFGAEPRKVGLTVRTSLRTAAVLAVSMCLFGIAAAADAAPPYATEATVSDIRFTSTEATSGSQAAIQADWSLPDNPATPAGFSVPLPTELQGRTDAFPLTDSAGAVAGQCTVTATELYCDIDSAYIRSHPLDLHGTFQFWVTVLTQVSQSTPTTYTVDGQATTVTVTPPPTSTCTQDCAFPGRPDSKWGWYNSADGTIEWDVSIGAGASGMAGGLSVQVDDTPGPNQQLVTSTASGTFPMIYRTNQVAYGADGYQTTVGWQLMDPSMYTVDSAGSVTFTTDAGYFYDIHFATKPTDAGQGGTRTYTNQATITTDGSSSAPVSGTVVYEGGHGTAAGTAVGRFAVTKHVNWPSAPVPGLAFTGTYTVTTPEGATASGTFTVADGATWTSPPFETGSTVHLTEDAPTGAAGLQWASPTFSQNGFGLGDGTVDAVTLTNTATLVHSVSPPAPVSGTQATPPPTSPPSRSTITALAHTGSSFDPAAVFAALAAVLVGVAAVALASVRARRVRR